MRVVSASSKLQVLHLNYSDIDGGAARAAYRIHHAIRDSGINSCMLVDVANSDDWTVKGPSSKLEKAIGRIRPYLATPLRKLLHTGNPLIHSPAILPSLWPKRINASDADLVHLHWVQGEMLSIVDISRIKKPIVWTLHDMWAFCGAEHVTSDYRWCDGYHRDNRPDHERGFDLNRNTWLRKRKHWRSSFQIVTPSQWLADCVGASALMGDWPVEVVPNPIDICRWQPIEKRLARHLLHLPQDCPLLLFGAMGGAKDPNKGFDLLVDALAKLFTEGNFYDVQLVVFGQLEPNPPLKFDFPVHYTGHLHDDLSLRALYSAADVMIVPSRLEAFGQTASESHACGTPVVSFHTSGLADIVVDRVTGALATPFDTRSLAASIRWVLENPARRHDLGVAARQRAVRLWSPARVAAMYQKIYKKTMDRG